MNAFKASVATLAFLGAVIISGVSGFLNPISNSAQFSEFHGFLVQFGLDLQWKSFACLFISGMIGLNLSDWLMLKAYGTIGPARTIILYRFQPLYLGLLSYLFLKQSLTLTQWMATFFLIACVFVLTMEGRLNRQSPLMVNPEGSVIPQGSPKKIKGHWAFNGILLALGGMILDGTGIVITRLAFDYEKVAQSASQGGLNIYVANFIRGASACLGFWLMSRWMPVKPHYFATFRSLSFEEKVKALSGAFFGTFVGLAFLFQAIRIGNIAMISALGALAPILAVTFESVITRKFPGKYTLLALLLCLIGFALLLSPS